MIENRPLLVVAVVVATVLVLAAFGRLTRPPHDPAYQPLPDRADDDQQPAHESLPANLSDAETARAEARWRLYLTRLANADVIPLSDGELDQLTAALPAVDPDLALMLVVRAASRTITAERNDHATDTGTDRSDLASRMVVSAELDLAAIDTLESHGHG